MFSLTFPLTKLELIRLGMFPLTRHQLIDLNWPWGVPSHILPGADRPASVPAMDSSFSNSPEHISIQVVLFVHRLFPLMGVFPLTFSLTRLELTDLGSVPSHLLPGADHPASVPSREYSTHITSQGTGAN